MLPCTNAGARPRFPKMRTGLPGWPEKPVRGRKDTFLPETLFRRDYSVGATTSCSDVKGSRRTVPAAKIDNR